MCLLREEDAAGSPRGPRRPWCAGREVHLEAAQSHSQPGFLRDRAGLGRRSLQDACQSSSLSRPSHCCKATVLSEPGKEGCGVNST